MNMNRISCYALALSCLLASCKDEMKDEEMPTVSITAPQADTKVWLETTLATEVMDNQGVSKVEFYLDGDLIGEATEAPYELMLDTKQYKDGTHLLRTVAYDGANNQSEAEREIEILNTLLTVEVDNEHFDPDSYRITREWIMVSDMQGNILQTEEMKNGMTYTFDRPNGLSDSLISTTYFYAHEYRNGNKEIFADTYYGISPDIWIFGKGYHANNTDIMLVGEATGSFMVSDYYYYSHSSEGYLHTDNAENFGDSIRVNFNLDMYKESAKMYLAEFPGDAPPLYILVDSVKAGDQYDLILDDFVAMPSIKTIMLPQVSSASMRVRGKYDINDPWSYRVSESQIDYNTNALRIYQPADIFKDFSYNFYAKNEALSYSRYDKGQVPSDYNIPESINLLVTSRDRKNFEASVDYTSDYLKVNWHDYDQEQSFSYARWSVFTSSGQKIQFSVPEVPKAIADVYPSLKDRMENLPLDYTYLRNQDNISSFKEYAAKRYKKDSDLYSYNTSEGVTIYSKDNNARKLTEELPQHIQDELEEHEMHRMRK